MAAHPAAAGEPPPLPPALPDLLHRHAGHRPHRELRLRLAADGRPPLARPGPRLAAGGGGLGPRRRRGGALLHGQPLHAGDRPGPRPAGRRAARRREARGSRLSRAAPGALVAGCRRAARFPRRRASRRRRQRPLRGGRPAPAGRASRRRGVGAGGDRPFPPRHPAPRLRTGRRAGGRALLLALGEPVAAAVRRGPAQRHRHRPRPGGAAAAAAAPDLVPRPPGGAPADPRPALLPRQRHRPRHPARRLLAGAAAPGPGGGRRGHARRRPCRPAPGPALPLRRRRQGLDGGVHDLLRPLRLLLLRPRLPPREIPPAAAAGPAGSRPGPAAPR